MKIFGYSTNVEEKEENTPSALAEITIEADAKELRMISEFLQQTANNMDSMGDTYDHEHLSDANHYFEESPHFVVVKPHK